MQNPGYYADRNRHYLAVIVAVLFIALLLFEFATFALGAYFVYDTNMSSVVADTTHSGSNAYLNITATGLEANTTRTIWIDPVIAYSSSGNPYVDVNSGMVLGNASVDINGTISGLFQISASALHHIQSDGQQVHSVWVAGIESSQLAGQPNYQALTTDSEENYTTSSLGYGITLFITLITFDVPFTFNLGQLFLALWTIYLILFAVALNGPFRSLIGAVRASAKEGLQALTGNAMFGMLIVFPVVLWGTVALSLLEQSAGVSTGNLPTVDPLLEFVELTIAPLREEIGFRVIPIGVVALVILFSKGRIRDGLMALWHPSRYLKKVRSPNEYKRDLKLMYAMIGFSAALFGLAHVLLGAGWGPGKIASAAAAGVALGGLYYVYGLPSAILLHWSIDYFLQVYTFGNNSIFLTLGEDVYLYTILLAVIGSVVLVLLLIRKLRRRPLELYAANWGPMVK